LLVNRTQINALLNQDLQLEAENVRRMRTGKLGTQPKYGFRLDDNIKERAEQQLAESVVSMESRPD
jgi:hypothetical protein